MTKWLLLAGAIASEVIASLCLKAALENPVLFVIVGAGYVAAFGLLGAVLRQGLALGVSSITWSWTMPNGSMGRSEGRS